jgi:hypothetical protein
MRSNMKLLTAKALYFAAVLVMLLLFASCDGPAPRVFADDSPYHNGVMTCIPYSAPGSYIVRYIAPDGGLWEYDERVLEYEEQPVKLMDGVLLVDDLSARTADNSLWRVGEPPAKIMDDVKFVTQGYWGVFIIKTDSSLWFYYSDGIKDNTEFIMEGVKHVASTENEILVVKNDSTLWKINWGPGEPNSGRVIIDASAPELLMSNIAHVFAFDMRDANRRRYMAIDNVGILWAWGTNGYGELGDGTNEDRLEPVKVMEWVDWVEPTYFGALAIKMDGSLWGWGAEVGSLSPVMLLDNESKIRHLRLSTYLKDFIDYYDNENGEKIAQDSVGLVSGVVIVREDGSLWTISPEPISGVNQDEADLVRNSVYILPPENIMGDVLYADGGFAVKTDGSLWRVHQNVMVLPPGTVWNGE